jgi:hypothetical protein
MGGFAKGNAKHGCAKKKKAMAPGMMGGRKFVCEADVARGALMRERELQPTPHPECTYIYLTL